MQFAGFLQFFIILSFQLGILCSSRNDLLRLDGRIVNGTKASLNQFPHQVSLRRSYSNTHFCGGNIIAEQWILTAAHCMFKDNGVKIAPWTILVTAGHVRLNQTDSNIQKRAVTAIILHKEFERSTYKNDIALLKVKIPFNFSTIHVKVAKLETKMPKPGTICRVAGWGYLDEDKRIVSNDLMYVDLSLINPIRCKELLVNFTNLPLGMFCAGYEEGLRDTCKGDSGGGMICGSALSGVVSGGKGCARPSLPGLYVDVPYYHNWVTYQIRNYNESYDSEIPAESTTKLVTTTEIPEVDLPSLEGRIVNGTKALLRQFPHQVSLRRSYSFSHFCGGSIIADQWILTAAHCMFKYTGSIYPPWTMVVTAGHVLLDQTDSYVQKRAVAAIIVHKNFNRSTLTNDIALLKIKIPFNLNTTNVKAATLETKMPKPGTKCKVSGWGYLDEKKPKVSNDLMYVDLPLINPKRCKELLVNVTHLPLGMFCAGYEEGLRDACQGDSGGGMICGNTLTGIVSGGEGCARPFLPGLYSDVPYYHNWVTYQIRNYDESYNGTIPRESTKLSMKKNNSSRFYSSLSLSAFFAIYSLLSFLQVTNFDRV